MPPPSRYRRKSVGRSFVWSIYFRFFWIVWSTTWNTYVTVLPSSSASGWRKTNQRLSPSNGLAPKRYSDYMFYCFPHSYSVCMCNHSSRQTCPLCNVDWDLIILSWPTTLRTSLTPRKNGTRWSSFRSSMDATSGPSALDSIYWNINRRILYFRNAGPFVLPPPLLADFSIVARYRLLRRKSWPGSRKRRTSTGGSRYSWSRRGIMPRSIAAPGGWLRWAD